MACGSCSAGSRTLEEALQGGEPVYTTGEEAFAPVETVQFAPVSTDPFKDISGLPWWALLLIGFYLHSLLK